MKSLVLILVLPLAFATQGVAYENFIPSGTGYSSEIDSIPELNSDRDKINAGTDLIESDLFRKARDAQVKDSYIRRFFSESESGGSDFSIDY
jgi:hypothetical protein